MKYQTLSTMRRWPWHLLLVTLLGFPAAPAARGQTEHSLSAPRVTSLTDRSVKFQVSDQHHVVLQRDGYTAVIVDNEAVDVPEAPGHRAGYNGLAVLRHENQPENLFVPSFAGLNFEHIHDGTLAVTREKFEPRQWPMQLRVIDDYTVELYQAPTPNWKLESCGRYQLLPGGVVQYTFECIPRADVFENGFIGLFWASYINSPQDKAIYFQGHRRDSSKQNQWIRAVSPQHGTLSTHPPAGYDSSPIQIHPDFPLTLVNHPSEYVHDEAWYYGVRGKMALALIFRPRDQIWFAQSPTGGGATNPAWDFQWFIPDYQVDQAYGFVMRAAYLTTTDRDEIAASIR